MKRIISLLLCAVMLIGFSACGKEETVKVNIPAIYLSAEEISDLPGYCEANGYISAEYNKRSDTVILKMSKLANEMQLVRIGMRVVEALYKLVESDSFPYLTEIGEYSEDFSTITVKVDAAKYNADDTKSLLSLTVGQTCLLYGTYTTNKNPECTVTIVDAETGETLDVTTHNTKE